MARVDYDALSDSYDRHRAVPDAGRAAWAPALRPYLGAPGTAGRPVLDAGAGTGQWSGLLERWFARPVVLLDRNRRMLAAPRSGGRPRVLADAARLPFAGRTFGGIWASAMVHHLPDPADFLAEAARTLAPGGYLVLRGAFPDRPELRLSVLELFPASRTVLDTFPALADLAGRAASAGLRLHEVRGVPEGGPAGWTDYHDRVRHRADTLLQGIPDAAFAAGLDRIRDRVAADAPPPAPSRLIMAAFRRDP